MGPLTRRSPTAICVLASLVATPSEAFGYIDPGTGSYMLQMLAAGLLGAAFALKGVWRNVRASLRNFVSRDR